MNYDKGKKLVIEGLCIICSMVYLYTAGFGSFSAMTQRALLLMLLGPIAFLGSKKKYFGNERLTNIVNTIFVILLVFCNIYMLVVWKSRILKTGATPTMDIVVATILIMMLLIGSYISSGKFLTITASLFLLYAIVGPYLPTFIAHRGESWSRIANFLYMTSEGIYGTSLGTASTYIIIFVVFGAFLNAFGGGKWFVDCAYALTGTYRGGPAKTAIFASALMGMISGAPAANVATTGTFTIPLMKKIGYKPHVAGAIEAVASTGGFFTPPIMGAAAFIIADYLQVPYWDVCTAAVVPCVLFYLALLLSVDAQAVKQGMVGIKKSDLPAIGQVMKERGFLGIPVVCLIAAIIIGWSPTKSAFWSTMLTVFVAFLKSSTRPNKESIKTALVNGSRQAVSIVMVCATAGIIVGVISLTGLGAKMSYTLLAFANGNLYIGAMLAMLICLILGCAMPPIAVYIILAAILINPLVQMGTTPMAAHMFIFIFSSLGALTPPVAITAFAGAAIAEANPNETGITAFRFGLPGYIVPFMFITSPAIIMQGSVAEICMTVSTCIVAVMCLVGALEGYCVVHYSKLSRALLAVAAILLFWPGHITDIVGIILIAVSVGISMKDPLNLKEKKHGN